MRLTLHERVETALRYLAPEEQKRAINALEALKHQNARLNRQRLPRLSPSQGSEQLFLYRVSPRLRAIVRYSEDDSAVVIEDLVSHAVLKRHFRRVDS